MKRHLTLPRWKPATDAVKLRMADEADRVAYALTTRELQYLVRELREHIAHRRTIRTRPLVEFETVKGRPDRIGSGKRK